MSARLSAQAEQKRKEEAEAQAKKEQEQRWAAEEEALRKLPKDEPPYLM